MTKRGWVFTALAMVAVISCAQAALRNVNSWYAMQSSIPSSYSSYEARSIVSHVQDQCQRSRGGYSDAGSGMTAPSLRVDRTCQQGGTCSGELHIPNGDTIRFGIGC
jgi:hypothetical protein